MNKYIDVMKKYRDKYREENKINNKLRSELYDSKKNTVNIQNETKNKIVNNTIVINE